MNTVLKKKTPNILYKCRISGYRQWQMHIEDTQLTVFDLKTMATLYTPIKYNTLECKELFTLHIHLYTHSELKQV